MFQIESFADSADSCRAADLSWRNLHKMSACSDWNRQTQQLQCWGAQNGCKRSLAYITSLQSTATKVCSQNGHKWKAMSESYVETCFISSSHFLLFWGRRPKSIWGASSKMWTWGVNISTPIYVTCDNICRSKFCCQEFGISCHPKIKIQHAIHCSYTDFFQRINLNMWLSS